MMAAAVELVRRVERDRLRWRRSPPPAAAKTCANAVAAVQLLHMQSVSCRRGSCTKMSRPMEVGATVVEENFRSGRYGGGCLRSHIVH